MGSKFGHVCTKYKGKRGCFFFIELYVVLSNRCRNARYFIVNYNLDIHSHWNLIYFFPRDLWREQDTLYKCNLCKAYFTLHLFCLAYHTEYFGG